MSNEFKKKLAIKFLIYSLGVSILPVMGIYIVSGNYLSDLGDFLVEVNEDLNRVVEEGVGFDEGELSIEKVVERFNEMSILMNHSIESVESTNYIILLLSLMMVTLCAFMVIIKVKGDIQFIGEGLLAIGDRDFSKRLEINRSDEIGVVVREFNRMAKNLEDKEKILNHLLEEDLFMQSMPKLSELKIIANNLSKGGGRHFGYIHLPFKRLAFFIVDSIEEKNLGEKKLDLFLRNYFQFFFRHEFENYVRVDDFCNSLNQKLLLLGKRYNFYINGFCGVLDLKSYRLTFVNNGFKGAIYFSGSGKGIQSVSNIKGRSYGRMDKYKQKTIQLERRDKLLFFNQNLRFESSQQGYSISLNNHLQETILESSFINLLKKLPGMVVDGRIGETTILFEIL